MILSSSALIQPILRLGTNVFEKLPKWKEFFGIFELILIFFLSKKSSLYGLSSIKTPSSSSTIFAISSLFVLLYVVALGFWKSGIKFANFVFWKQRYYNWRAIIFGCNEYF